MVAVVPSPSPLVRVLPGVAVDGVDAAIDVLSESLVSRSMTAEEAAAVIERIEQCRTKLAWCGSRMIMVIEYDGLHREFDHKSGRDMYRHMGQTTGSEAYQLDQVAQWKDGEIVTLSWRTRPER